MQYQCDPSKNKNNVLSSKFKKAKRMYKKETIKYSICNVRYRRWGISCKKVGWNVKN